MAAEVSCGLGPLDGRSGGALQTVWELLLEIERFNGNAKEEDLGAVTLVLDLWAWATQDLASAVRVL